MWGAHTVPACHTHIHARTPLNTLTHKGCYGAALAHCCFGCLLPDVPPKTYITTPSTKNIFKKPHTHKMHTLDGSLFLTRSLSILGFLVVVVSVSHTQTRQWWIPLDDKTRKYATEDETRNRQGTAESQRKHTKSIVLTYEFVS